MLRPVLPAVLAVSVATGGCAQAMQGDQPSAAVADDAADPGVATTTHVVRVVATTPPLLLPANAIESERTTRHTTTLLPFQRATTRTARYSGRSAVVPVRPDVQVAFGLTPLDLVEPDVLNPEILSPLVLSLSVRNRSTQPVRIEWDGVRLADDRGVEHPVVHRVVRSAGRSGAAAAGAVAPGATLHDFVYPRNGSRTWSYFDDLRPGQRFTLTLPVAYGDQRSVYRFVFEVLP